MAANNNMDRQLENALGELLKWLGRLLGSFFKGLFRGIKKLNCVGAWTGLLCAVAVAYLTRRLKFVLWSINMPDYIRWMIFSILVTAPIWYLLILGGKDKADKDYEKLFQDIGFVGKDGNPPKFTGSRTDGKKSILSFRSNIPLADWRTAKNRLETAIDCNILKMEYGNSKKIVQLTILPADFRIPEMIRWNDEYCSRQNGVVTIGQGALGNISFNLNRVPHVLVAGETGSGKSVILRCILWQMIMQGSRVYMIDFKGGVEFGKQYERFGEVVTERERALDILNMLVEENAHRLRLFRDLEVKNLAEYNKKTGQNLCRIGVFSDELAEMLDKKGVSKEDKPIFEALEGRLSTLARLSRATGINLFLGVQRPDANVLTGQIKNNVPVRISGRFADKAASEIVLGNTDAVELPDIKGRFLYKVGNETIEFQSFFFDDESMLHDVFVEQGDMLLDTPEYKYGGDVTNEERNKSNGTAPKTAEETGKKTGRYTKKKESCTNQDSDIMLDMEFDYGELQAEEPLPF